MNEKKKPERPLSIKIEGFSDEELKDLTIPTKMGDTELDWKVPSFCPRCEEIRADFGGGTIISSVTHTLAWKSFGMCEMCYIFQRDHPEKAEKNKIAFIERQKEKQQKSVEQMKEHRFRVYILETNDKLPSAPFASTVTNLKFTRFPSMTSKGSANHTIQLLSEDVARETVQTLINKELICWYDDLEYQEFFKKA